MKDGHPRNTLKASSPLASGGFSWLVVTWKTLFTPSKGRMGYGWGNISPHSCCLQNSGEIRYCRQWIVFIHQRPMDEQAHSITDSWECHESRGRRLASSCTGIHGGHEDNLGVVWRTVQTGDESCRHPKCSLCILCRFDFGLMFDGDGNLSYFVNEVERLQTMSLWFRTVEDTSMWGMVNIFTHVLHTQTISLKGRPMWQL